jgi:hypothetical protein
LLLWFDIWYRVVSQTCCCSRFLLRVMSRLLWFIIIVIIACLLGNSGSGFDIRFVGYSPGGITINYNTYNLTVAVTLRSSEQWQHSKGRCSAPHTSRPQSGCLCPLKRFCLNSLSAYCLALEIAILQLNREHLSYQLSLFCCSATTICCYDNTCLYNRWLVMGVGSYATPLTIGHIGIVKMLSYNCLSNSLLRKWRFSTQRVQLSHYYYYCR